MAIVRRLIPLDYDVFGGDVAVQPEHVVAVRTVVYQATGEYSIVVYFGGGSEVIESKRVKSSDDAEMKRMRAAWDALLDQLRIALEAA